MIPRRRPPLAPWVLLAILVAGPAFARKPKNVVPCSDLPPWITEAAGRDVVPSGKTDLVWLHEERQVEPLADGGVRETERRVARVLGPSAMDDVGRWAVPYRSEDRWEAGAAWTATPDGLCRRSDPKEDPEDYPAVAGFSVYEDSRVRILPSPAVTVGGVVAFESVVVRAQDRGASEWTFGVTDRPAAVSRFSLKVPEGWSREIVPFHMEGHEVAVDESPDAVAYTLLDLRPLPKIEFPPPASARLPRIWGRWWDPSGTRGYRDWDAVGRWYRALAEPVLEDADLARAIAAGMRPEGPERLLQAVEGVFRFAARDVRYVSIQIGIGGYRPSSPNEVCNLKYGDCKAKAFLVRSMVESWDRKTYPILVATRETGEVDPEVPTPAQFNHCIVAVSLPDGIGDGLWSVLPTERFGRLAILDPTAGLGAPWELPLADQDTLGLLVHEDGAELIRLPRQPPEASRAERRFEAAVTDAADIRNGKLVETWSQTSASRVRAYYQTRSESQRLGAAASDLQDRFPGATVKEHRIEGLDTVGSPLTETVEFTGGRIGQRTAGLLILQPGSAGYGIVGSALPPPPRPYDLDLDHAREEIVEATVEVPAGWRPEELPAPVAVESDDVQARCEWAFRDGRLSYRRSSRLLVPRIPPDRYGAFRADVKRLQAADRTAVVLVRDETRPTGR